MDYEFDEFYNTKTYVTIINKIMEMLIWRNKCISILNLLIQENGHKCNRYNSDFDQCGD